MSNQEKPIFTKTFDFLSWLVPATNNFRAPSGFIPPKGYWKDGVKPSGFY